MKIWSDDEVISLFKSVQDCKDANKSLKLAFEVHAKAYKRRPNSVRNYYYKEVDNLCADVSRCQRLGIDLDKHTKNHITVFGQAEEDLLKQIDVLTKQGYSVRSACQKLSGGDLALMTRLQNKYQNEKKKQTGKVIPFRNRQKSLTEAEINSLFLGLVKLIKKTAVEDIMEKTKQEKESSALLLKKAFVDLGKKDMQIAELQESFKLLKSENEKLIAKLEESVQGKNQALKDHFKKKILAQTSEN